MARNRPLAYVAIIIAFIFFYSYLQFPGTSTTSRPESPYDTGKSPAGGYHGGTKLSPVKVDSGTVHGDVIMPKLGNETIKAELGRASWRLLHTMLARFPEKPDADQRDALKSYIYLFSRLYPCGECAAHFQKLLQKYPPQTSSRDAASQWGCVVHNAVNERLGKEIFDCGTIADKYHCGCADEDENGNKKTDGAAGDDAGGDLVKSSSGETTEKKKKKQRPVPSDEDLEGELKLEKEGLTRGG